jgi:hypothetical protein
LCAPHPCAHSHGWSLAVDLALGEVLGACRLVLVWHESDDVHAKKMSGERGFNIGGCFPYTLSRSLIRPCAIDTLSRYISRRCIQPENYSTSLYKRYLTMRVIPSVRIITRPELINVLIMSSTMNLASLANGQTTNFSSRTRSNHMANGN